MKTQSSKKPQRYWRKEMQTYCPVCNQRFSFNPYTDTDYIHTCTTGKDALDNQDLLRLGTYVDDNGVTQTVPNPLMQGIENKFFGTRAGIEGGNLGALTARGNNKSTHRTHRRLM